MNIIDGFGLCNIDIMVDGVWQHHPFKIDRVSSVREEVEVSDKFPNIFFNNKKHIYGYHYSFNLVVKNSVDNSQEGLIKFKKNYRRLASDDKAVYLYPVFADDATNWTDVSINNLGYFKVHIDNISEAPFADSDRYGKIMTISCSTVDMIPVTELKEVIYRSTVSNNWGITNKTTHGITPYSQVGVAS